LIRAFYAEAKLSDSASIAPSKTTVVDCDQSRAPQQPIHCRGNSIADDDEVNAICFCIIGVLYDFLQDGCFIAVPIANIVGNQVDGLQRIVKETGHDRSLRE
jgi:hypothetical protein